MPTTSANKITDLEELLQIMWMLKVCSVLNWEQMWAEYISPHHPEEDCAACKVEMEKQLGYPLLHFGDEADENGGYRG